MATALMTVAACSILFFLLEHLAGNGSTKQTLRFGLGVVFIAVILETIITLLGGM